MTANMIYPIQPSFVLYTSMYLKKKFSNIAIAHCYCFFCEKKQVEMPFVVPDGTLDIIFCCDEQEPSAFIYGSVDAAHAHQFKEGRLYFGVRFIPGLLNSFLDFSMPELLNQKISLSSVKNMSGLVEAICRQAGFQQQINLFLDAFCDILPVDQMSYKAAIVQNAMTIIKQNAGNVRLLQLERYTNYSGRYLNKVFHEYTGFSIKQFCKIIRFQHILKIFSYGEYNRMIDLIQNCGYNDQSHFIKDFKEYIHLSPSVYQRVIDKQNYLRKIILM